MSDYIAFLICITCTGARMHYGVSPALSPKQLPHLPRQEVTVVVNSALHGAPRIALGNALGSSVVNVALILAAALLIAPITTTRDMVGRDLPVALTVPVIVAVLFFEGLP